MARSNSILKFQGTLGDVTFVRSSTYGDHVRARRGTHKPAGVNESFKRESSKLIAANVPARLIKNAIDPYRGGLSDGNLWQRLVSLFRKQKVDSGVDFSILKGLEVHTNHRLASIFCCRCDVALEKSGTELNVEIHYEHPPTFHKGKAVNGYRITVIGVFPDLKTNTSVVISSQSEVLLIGKVASPQKMSLSVPEGAEHFVIWLKIEGYEHEKPAELKSTTGICVVEAGRIKIKV